MYEYGKSDNPIVPRTLSNKDGNALPFAERVEERGLTKGNSPQPNKCRTQGRESLQNSLERIRQAAAGDKTLQFTSLWHHVYKIECLREAYRGINRHSTPGMDDQTWQEYGEDLEANLQSLSSRLKRGAYRARPVKRVYIPKPDGRQRPIGITTLEDKIVQRAVTTVLNAIYEVDFKGFSYGFRPGRGAHNALDALTVGILKRKVDWILDADICGFFDAIDHKWLIKFIEHRIGDPRVIRHIKKWLNAGVLEDGKHIRMQKGTPQGGSISPLLANIYLHYAFDLWAEQWRKRYVQGHMIVVRYADDIVAGFQYQSEAQRFRKDLRARLLRFNLELHPSKTRLLQFGRFAAERRAAQGKGKPETFDFLGFTHICAKSSKGTFMLLRLPMRKRVQATLKAIKEQLKLRRYTSIPEMGRWLASVMRGWYQYYAVPNTYRYLGKFRRRAAWLWYRALNRRSQRSRMTWRRMYKLIAKWLPLPRIVHPYPQERLWDTEYSIPMRNATCTTVAPTGSISLLAECSNGIEPVYHWVMRRRAIEGQDFVQIHPLLERLGRREGWLNEETRAQLVDGCPIEDVSGIPSKTVNCLVTAHEVSPEWHCKIQGAFQRHVDNAVSKTINLPGEASVDDVDRAFQLAYDHGCKGVTVYRDGSREGQVLSRNDQNVGTENESPGGLRPRAHVTAGHTSKFRMGCGTLFVTVNKDEHGICEVFANLGKAGGCPSQSEATCRVVSAALRSGVAPEILIDQLSNIRCLSAVVACRKDSRVNVLSCPDAIAKALRQATKQDCLSVQESRMQTLCPECGGLMRREGGCIQCDRCGFNKCG